MTLPLFIALAAGVLALALWPLLQVLLRPPAANTDRAVAPHLSLLHADRAQLDADRAAGCIGVDEHAQAQAELARRVLQETTHTEPALGSAHRKLTAGFLLLAVPALAVGLYGTLGQPGALREAASPATEGATLADVDAMVRQMQQALERRSGAGNSDAEDAQAWAMLARSQAGLQRHAQAAESYARAIALDPRNPQLLADRADLISLLQGPGAHAEAAQLVQRALASDPGHPKALALAGRAAYEKQDFAAADAYWRRARAGVPPGSAFAEGLDRSIEAARAGAQANASARTSNAAATAPAGISGRVEIAPALRGRLQPGDTLFIVARTPQGPRLPLAVLRLPATTTPTEFTLGDEHAMTADHKLSGQAQVVVEARVSRTGNAMPQAGDVLGRTAVIDNTARGLRVVVDQVVP